MRCDRTSAVKVVTQLSDYVALATAFSPAVNARFSLGRFLIFPSELLTGPALQILLPPQNLQVRTKDDES